MHARGRGKAAALSADPLAEENAALRRELADARKQLAAALTTPVERTPAERHADAASAMAWMAAQLAQSQRQVGVLSQALLARSHIAAELDAVLGQLATPAPDGTRSEAAAWAAAAMRRLRQVQFVGGLAPKLSDAAAKYCLPDAQPPAPPPSGRAAPTERRGQHAAAGMW